MRLFHGTAINLAPGDELLPPAVTGVRTHRMQFWMIDDQLGEVTEVDDGTGDLGYVFATDDLDLARWYARRASHDFPFYRDARVYAVELNPPIASRLDNDDLVYFSPSGVIVRQVWPSALSAALTRLARFA